MPSNRPKPASNPSRFPQPDPRPPKKQDCQKLSSRARERDDQNFQRMEETRFPEQARKERPPHSCYTSDNDGNARKQRFPDDSGSYGMGDHYPSAQGASNSRNSSYRPVNNDDDAWEQRPRKENVHHAAVNMRHDGEKYEFSEKLRRDSFGQINAGRIEVRDYEDELDYDSDHPWRGVPPLLSPDRRDQKARQKRDAELVDMENLSLADPGLRNETHYSAHRQQKRDNYPHGKNARFEPEPEGYRSRGSESRTYENLYGDRDRRQRTAGKEAATKKSARDRR